MTAPKFRALVNGFEERPIKRRRAYVEADVRQELLPLGHVRSVEEEEPADEADRRAGWPTLAGVAAAKGGSHG